jgi:signal transduction histidine kinase
MADAITLLNQTIMNQTFTQQYMEQITTKINTIAALFKALGGIFLAWIILTIVNWIRQSKQKKLLIEINKKLGKLLKKR